MPKSIISTGAAPEAVGPYSQAVKAGSYLYISGQLPLRPDGTMVEGEIKAQTARCLENIKAILAAAGLTLDHVVKATIYLTDMNLFGQLNEVYASYFQDNPPARACIGAASLPKGALVEIEAVACAE